MTITGYRILMPDRATVSIAWDCEDSREAALPEVARLLKLGGKITKRITAKPEQAPGQHATTEKS